MLIAIEHVIAIDFDPSLFFATLGYVLLPLVVAEEEEFVGSISTFKKKSIFEKISYKFSIF